MAQLAQNLVQNTNLSINLGGWIITTTEDKVRLAVITHLARMEQKQAWVTPAGVFVTVAATLATATFKDAWLSPATWEAVFLLVGAASFVWLVVAVVRALKAPSVEVFIDSLRSAQLPQLPLVQPVSAESALLTRRWVLVFNRNSQSGSKAVTFLRDGKVGEGSNKNESSWRLSGDVLEFRNEEGALQSAFRFNEGQQRWVQTAESYTRTARHQYMYSEPTASVG